MRPFLLLAVDILRLLSSKLGTDPNEMVQLSVQLLAC